MASRTYGRLGSAGIFGIALAVQSCSSGGSTDARERLENVVVTLAENALAVTRIRFLNGTYGPGCEGREADNWSIPVASSLAPEELAHPPLRLLRADEGEPCLLVLTEIVARSLSGKQVQDNVTFVSAGITLASEYAQEALVFESDDTRFYGNARFVRDSEPNEIELAVSLEPAFEDVPVGQGKAPPPP